jgi:hypothetical protein
MAITSEQCRAGRILAKVQPDLLATEAGVDVEKVKAFEAGLAVPDGMLADLLQHALERLGIEFLPEEDGWGVGIRLRFDRSQTRQIGRLETEGGPAADDDVP